MFYEKTYKDGNRKLPELLLHHIAKLKTKNKKSSKIKPQAKFDRREITPLKKKVVNLQRTCFVPGAAAYIVQKARNTHLKECHAMSPLFILHKIQNAG